MSDTGTARAHDSDHDLLIRIDTKLDLYMQRQTAFETEMRDGMARLWARAEVLEVKKTSVDVSKDQEHRLRKVERFAYIGVGIAFFFEAILTAYLSLHH